MAAFITLFKFSDGFAEPRRSVARGVSVAAFLAVAWMLWRGAAEYGELLRLERDNIPPARYESMRSWLALSRVLVAAVLCVAAFSAAHAIASRK